MPERPGSVPDTDLVALLLDVRNDVRSSGAETRAGFSAIHAKFDGLNSKMDLHARDDVSMEARLRDEIGSVRSSHARTAEIVAKITGERDVEGRFGPNGTGRYPVVPPAHDSGTTVIPTPGIAINIGDTHGRRNRHSTAPLMDALGKFFGSVSGKVGAAVSLVLVGYLTRYVHAAAAIPPAPVTIVAAPQPPPAEVAPSPPPALATAAPVAPDAGIPGRKTPR